MNDKDKNKELQEEDKTVFVPDEIYHNFYSALDRMEQAQEEFRKIAEKRPQTEN